MNFKNSEGYLDTTASKAIDKMAKEECIRREMIESRDDFINDAIKCFKRMIRLGGFELIERIEVRDKVTGKEYR